MLARSFEVTLILNTGTSIEEVLLPWTVLQWTTRFLVKGSNDGLLAVERRRWWECQERENVDSNNVQNL